MRRDPLGFLLASAREYGDVVLLPVGVKRLFLVNRPDLIDHVLRKPDRAKYQKSSKHQLYKSMMGNSLFVAEGDEWASRRQILQKSFRAERIAAAIPGIVGATEALIGRWDQVAAAGGTVDIAHEMMRLTVDIICRVMFSTDLGEMTNEVDELVSIASEFVHRRWLSLLRLPESAPSPRNIRYRASRARLNRIVYGIIQDRRKAQLKPPDMLTDLMESRDEDGRSLSDEAVRDEVMTIFLAGHETTALSLAWTWYLLSLHPDVRRRLDDSLRGFPDGQPTMAEIAGLGYTRQVLMESMRLYPPAWGLTRDAKEGDELDGYDIPAGSMVIMSPYVIHRDSRYWTNPEGFDPDRFEGDVRPPAGSYFPFGEGPRRCIGEVFSMMEAKLILALVSRKYDLDLIPGHRVVPDPMITLRPRWGIKMLLRRRPIGSTADVAERTREEGVGKEPG